MALTVTDLGDVPVTFNPGGVVTARKIKLAWADTDTHAATASATFPTVPASQGVVLDCSGETFGTVYAAMVGAATSRYSGNGWVSLQFTENGTAIKAAVLRGNNPPIAQIFQGATGNL